MCTPLRPRCVHTVAVCAYVCVPCANTDRHIHHSQQCQHRGNHHHYHISHHHKLSPFTVAVSLCLKVPEAAQAAPGQVPSDSKDGQERSGSTARGEGGRMLPAGGELGEGRPSWASCRLCAAAERPPLAVGCGHGRSAHVAAGPGRSAHGAAPS